MNAEIWTIRNVIEWTDGFFRSKGVESSRLDAELLLSHLLQCDRVFLYCHFDEPLDTKHLAEYRALVAQRGRRVPLAYLTGRKEFMSINFMVTPDVLVPRPETETLVEAALELLRGQQCKLLDLCTGCGTIAVSMAFHHNGAELIATDISDDALVVARDNAQEFGVDRRIMFRQGDLFNPVPEDDFDAILCNPPYVAEHDRDRLQPEVRDHEPALALFCPTDAAQLYGDLARGAAQRLVPGGWLFTEVGYDSHAVSIEQIESTGAFEQIALIRDLAGQERVVKARKTNDG